MLGSLYTTGNGEDLVVVTLVCKVVILSTQNQDMGLEKQLGLFQARIAKEKVDRVENVDKKKSDKMHPEIRILKVGVHYVLKVPRIHVVSINPPSSSDRLEPSEIRASVCT